MKTIIAAIALAVASLSANVLAADLPECQVLTPADSAVLTVAQLKVRYCEAKAKKDFGDGLYKIYAPAGGSRILNTITDEYASCSVAMTSIARLLAEKKTKNKKLIDDNFCD